MNEMFRTPESRTALRAALAAVLSTLSAAAGIWVGNPYISLASAAVGTIALWYGVGYKTPTEPFLGNGKVVEVPANKIEPT